jgi:5-methylcytosine-specific restriction endonuclease McrA
MVKHISYSNQDIENALDRIIKIAKENMKKENNTMNKFTTQNLKKRHIPSTIKRLVWHQYIGEDIGKAKCLCCKTTDITQLSFHCGHVVSEACGGEICVDNLRPICQNCNSSMGVMNMDDFMTKYKI